MERLPAQLYVLSDYRGFAQKPVRKNDVPWPIPELWLFANQQNYNFLYIKLFPVEPITPLPAIFPPMEFLDQYDAFDKDQYDQFLGVANCLHTLFEYDKLTNAGLRPKIHRLVLW